MKRNALLCLGALALSTSAFAAGKFDVRRAAMVAQLRAMLREQAPAADDAAFEQALAAVSRVPRERFAPAAARDLAYRIVPLNIGYGQTISDPYIVSLMTAAARLSPDAEVLDVGTGSGYQAAVLSGLVRHVSSVEIVAPLAKEAARRLHRLGYRNVTVRAGDGFAGWPDQAPFDAIIVAAGAAKIPQPLVDQLKPGGRLVIPIGPSTAQEQLLVVTKGADGTLTQCSIGLAMFVPLTGVGERPVGTRGLIDRNIRLCYGTSAT